MALRVLLVDGDPEDLAREEGLLSQLGLQVTAVRDGQEALRIYCARRPDVLLADMDLPGLSGPELARAAQAECAPAWLPVILFSGAATDDHRRQALEAGADSHFAKPLSSRDLGPRLRQFGRLLAMQRRLTDRAREVEKFRVRQAEEHEVARHLMERLISAEKLNDPALQHWIAANESFSGDVIAAARTPAGVLHVLLADGTGHGLAAALNVLPVISPFYGMTAKGYSPEAIVREINRKVREILPRSRFIATSLVSVDFDNRLAQAWIGGNPPLLVVGEDGGVRYHLGARHLALGILPEEDFDAHPDSFSLEGVKDILLFSDGLPEAENADGMAFGLARVLEAARSGSEGNALERLLDAVHDHLGECAARDDLSCALVSCPAGKSEPSDGGALREGPSPAGAAALGWGCSLRLGAAEIRRQDAVPMLLNLIEQFRPARAHAAVLFTVLTELYNNALEHGLLDMADAAGRGGKGRRGWLAEREARLARLDHGEIELAAEQLCQDGVGFLRIRCRDSGPGFDHETLLAELDRCQAEGRAHGGGRGIPRLRKLCRLVFHGRGNEAEVFFPLSAP